MHRKRNKNSSFYANFYVFYYSPNYGNDKTMSFLLAAIAISIVVAVTIVVVTVAVVAIVL